MTTDITISVHPPHLPSGVGLGSFTNACKQLAADRGYVAEFVLENDGRRQTETPLDEAIGMDATVEQKLYNDAVASVLSDPARWAAVLLDEPVDGPDEIAVDANEEAAQTLARKRSLIGAAIGEDPNSDIVTEAVVNDLATAFEGNPCAEVEPEDLGPRYEPVEDDPCTIYDVDRSDPKAAYAHQLQSNEDAALVLKAAFKAAFDAKRTEREFGVDPESVSGKSLRAISDRAFAVYEAAKRLVETTLVGVLGDARVERGLTVHTPDGPAVIATILRLDDLEAPDSYSRQFVLTEDGGPVEAGWHEANAEVDTQLPDVRFEVWESRLPRTEDGYASAGGAPSWTLPLHGYVHPISRKLVQEG
jgi:hypothetical protein